MSTAVINPHRALNDFTKKLSDNRYGNRFGEVFITEHHTAILRCCFCEEEHLVYQQFLEHIFAHYYSNIGSTALHLTSAAAPAEMVALDLEERKNPPVGIFPVEFATEVLHEVENFQLAENATEVNSLCEVQIELKEEEPTELYELPLIEAAHEISCAPDKDDPVRVTSESSRESSPKPKPKRKYTRQKPSAKKQPKMYNDRIHKCETCGVILKTRRGLREHNRRHTDERPYMCKFCGGSFITASRLGRHEKRHERRLANARTFKCEICGKGFNEAVHLKAHMVGHTGERNHVCSVCSAAFLYRKNLVAHIKIHTNAREYACSICGEAFNQPASRLLHMRNRHKVATNSTSTKRT